MEENRREYIRVSKANIDRAILNVRYNEAFGLLIVFLERLNNEERADVINYYSKNLGNFPLDLVRLEKERECQQ